MRTTSRAGFSSVFLEDNRRTVPIALPALEHGYFAKNLVVDVGREAFRLTLARLIACAAELEISTAAAEHVAAIRAIRA
jgi:hypothetical protein